MVIAYFVYYVAKCAQNANILSCILERLKERGAISGDGNEFVDAIDKNEDAFDDTFRVWRFDMHTFVQVYSTAHKCRLI